MARTIVGLWMSETCSYDVYHENNLCGVCEKLYGQELDAKIIIPPIFDDIKFYGSWMMLNYQGFYSVVPISRIEEVGQKAFQLYNELRKLL